MYSFDRWDFHQFALIVTTHRVKLAYTEIAASIRARREASVLYSNCDIELAAISHQL